jgi:activator of 2-hydroxyglutaryl-CoA dehydratase
MTGGVALNKDMVTVMAKELRHPVEAAPYPQLAGAIGAASYAFEKHVVKEEANHV